MNRQTSRDRQYIRAIRTPLESAVRSFLGKRRLQPQVEAVLSPTLLAIAMSAKGFHYTKCVPDDEGNAVKLASQFQRDGHYTEHADIFGNRKVIKVESIPFKGQVYQVMVYTGGAPAVSQLTDRRDLIDLLETTFPRTQRVFTSGHA